MSPSWAVAQVCRGPSGQEEKEEGRGQADEGGVGGHEGGGGVGRAGQEGK